MLSEDLRKRIAALNKKSLQPEPVVDQKEAAPQRRPEQKRRTKSSPSVPPADPPAPDELRVGPTASDARLKLALQDVAPGVEVENEAGQFLLMDRSFQEVLPGGGDGFQTRYVQTLTDLDRAAVPADRYQTFDPLATVGAEGLLYVDIEATGLTAGTPLFLVGALVFSGGSLRVQQFLARDYTEEVALLMHFSGVLEASQVVVSFNGKTYDLPYIRDRSIFMNVPFRLWQDHIDLLHVARRRWRAQLPNCKLQTLEKYICKRIRKGDIPGSEIPDAYHRFVQTGNAVQMRDILHHNALDLITMAEVLMFVLEGRDL
ncbi:MAG: ribonuclease H-like domain-containing protein [bacterium]|nr:ribonuclease H-like domain-containing protein [bacterium]